MNEMVRIPLWALLSAGVLVVIALFWVYSRGSRDSYEYEIDERRRTREANAELREANAELVAKINEWDDHCEYLQSVIATVKSHARFWKKIAVSMGWHKHPKAERPG